MKNIKNKIIIFILLAVLGGIILSSVKFYYFDIYLMSLNGRVDKINVNIQEAMTVIVSKEEHNIAHFWPVFQKNVEVGDSVYKKQKGYDIILIKKGTKQRIICKYQ